MAVQFLTCDNHITDFFFMLLQWKLLCGTPAVLSVYVPFFSFSLVCIYVKMVAEKKEKSIIWTAFKYTNLYL